MANPLTDRWLPLKPHKVQSAVWRDPYRFKHIVAGRGSGKTEIAKRYLARLLPVKKPWHDPRYAFTAPTRDQAARCAWQDLIDMIPSEWLAGEPMKSTLTINTIWGSSISLIGMDKPHRIEGVQWDGVIMDESSDQKPEAFDLSVRPALTHRTGFCWRIGVPKRQGCGARDFKKAYDRALTNEEADTASYTWPSWDILAESEIAAMKNSLSPKDFLEQAGASWETASGLCFDSFSPENISTIAHYDPSRPVIVGSDFNVNPMSWVLMHQIGNELHVFDELYIRNTNTRATLDILWSRYGEAHKSSWHFIGDAAASQRRTSADFTDYMHIMNAKRFKPTTSYPAANPTIRSRMAACNARFCNVVGMRRVFINPICTNLVTDLQNRALGKDGKPDDSHPDSGHPSDALGYVIHRLFPIALMEDTVEDATYTPIAIGA